MGLSYKGSIDFANSFNVTVTRPLDVRLVVDSVEDLINGSIKSPYKGMVVSIYGTSHLYVYIENGVHGANTLDDENIPENDKYNAWSRVSSVEVVDGIVDELHKDPLKNFDENYVLSQDVLDNLKNPEEGLILNIRNTDKLYVLVKPEDYERVDVDDYYKSGPKKGQVIPWNRRLRNFLRVGGITEEHAYQILTPEQHDAAIACVSNRFTDKHFYILLDPLKSRDGFSDPHPHVEMVTTEMLDDALDEVYETIDNVKKELDDKIDTVDRTVNQRIDNLENDVNNNVSEVDEKYQGEVDRLDERIDNSHDELDDKINTNNDSINKRVDNVENNLKSEIQEIDETYESEVDRLDEKIDRQDKEIKDEVDNVHDELDKKIDRNKAETDSDIDEVYQYFDGQGEEAEEKIDNVEKNLDDKINTNNDNINKRVDQVENDFNQNIEDVDNYYDGEVDRLDEKIDRQDNNLDNKIETNHNEITSRVDRVEEDLKSEIQDVDSHLDSETERLDDRITDESKRLDDKIDGVHDELTDKINNTEESFSKRLDDTDEHLDNEIDRLDDKIDNVNRTLDNKIEDNDFTVNNRIDIEIENVEQHIQDLREELLGPDWDEWYNDFTEVAEWIRIHKKEYEDLSALVEMVGRKHHEQINELYDLVKTQREEIDQLRKEMDELHRKIQEGEICSIYTCDECCNLIHYAMATYKPIPYMDSFGEIVELTDNSDAKHQHEDNTPHLFANVVYRPYHRWKNDEEARTLLLRYNSESDIEDGRGLDSRCTGIWIDLETHTLFIDKTDDIPYKRTQDEE